MSHPPPRPHSRRRRSATLGTTERGLGWTHQRHVARLKALLVDGTPCWWCGRGMWRTQQLSGDHSTPRSRGGTVTDRLLHLRCNSARGDGSRDHLRPALRPQPTPPVVGTPSRAW